MKKQILSIILICCMMFGVLSVGAFAEKPELPFTDVGETDWFYDEVCYVYGKKLMCGTSGTTFDPNSVAGRGTIVTILYRLEGEPSVINSCSFTDVMPGSWYEKAVIWANDNGIVEGYGNGKFGPEDALTREQLTAIMYRYANYKKYDTAVKSDLSGFTDRGKISDYAVDSFKWANAIGLIYGTTPSALAPTGNATRAQLAVIFYRFCNIFESRITIADILPEDFPAAEESATVPPASAWKDLLPNTQCYLSYDGSKLFFYNESGDPDKQFGISTDEVVSASDDNTYIYTDGDTITVTFSMSEGVLTYIIFADTDSDVWDGTYQESACIAAGTMITLEHGEQKAVEDLEIGDVIRTFNHETGEVSSAPVCFIWESKNAANAFTLTFEGGTAVTVIEEHGFYDKEEKGYAFINAGNAADYIGHYFYNADTDSWLELKSFEAISDGVDAYAIATSGHFNHLSNGMLSMCDGTFKIIANLFEYDDQMRFDEDKKQADIEMYGLTPIEKILELEGFYEADYYDYNLQYLNIAIGKGLVTWELMEALSDYCLDNGL